MDIFDLDESKIKRLSKIIMDIYDEDSRYMLFDSKPDEAYLEDMLLAKIAMLKEGMAVDLVAVEHDEIIGECEIVKVAGKTYAKVGIFLDKKRRGIGAGGAMLERALFRAREIGIDEVYAEVDDSNVRGKAFFSGKGFDDMGASKIGERAIRVLRKRM